MNVRGGELFVVPSYGFALGVRLRSPLDSFNIHGSDYRGEGSGHFDQLSHRVADSIPVTSCSLDHFHHRLLGRFHRKIYCPPMFISKVISYLVILIGKLRSHRITCPPQNVTTVRKNALSDSRTASFSSLVSLQYVAVLPLFSSIITDQFLGRTQSRSS